MLKRQALAAMLWSGGEVVSRQGLHFLATIILARILAPSDFGMVAMLAIFASFAVVLSDCGLSAAIIQRRDVTHADESSVFWFQLGLAVLLCVGLHVLSPAIGAMYELPELVSLLRFMSLSVIFVALGSIQAALLTKELNFRTQARAGAVAALVSGITAIGLASAGHGVWALAAQVVVLPAASTIMLWWLYPWRPAYRWRPDSMRRLLSFGTYHLGSSLLEAAFTRLHALLLGRSFGPTELGYYAGAESLRQMPLGPFGVVLSRAGFSLYARASDDAARLRRAVQLTTRVAMLINAPLMIFMAALAEPIVLTLFGDAWQGSVPVLRALCLAGLFVPMHSINLHALMAQGHARLMLGLEVRKKLIGVSLLLIGVLYGAIGIAWSLVAFSALALWLNAHYSLRFLRFGLREQLREVTPALVAAMAVGLVVHACCSMWTVSPWIECIVLLPLSAVLYLAVIWGMRLKALREVMALLAPADANGHGSRSKFGDG